VAGGEPAGGLSNGEGSRADAMENRSGVVNRVRPLPIRGSCRDQHNAARGPAPPRSRSPQASDAVKRDPRLATFAVRCAWRPGTGCPVHLAKASDILASGRNTTAEAAAGLRKSLGHGCLIEVNTPRRLCGARWLAFDSPGERDVSDVRLVRPRGPRPPALRTTAFMRAAARGQIRHVRSIRFHDRSTLARSGAARSPTVAAHKAGI
jgi:hypothetical protein